MKLSFTKMQGCANDYIYLTAAKAVCRRRSQPFQRIVPAALFHRRGRHHLHLRTGRQPGRTA